MMDYGAPRYRQYGPPFAVGRPLTPVVRGLLIANAVALFLRLLSGPAYAVVGDQVVSASHSLDLLFGLVPRLVLSRLYLWQFATYMFLHAGLLHFLINMFVLYMFGAEIEAVLGSRRFAVFYFFCGIGAGVCSFFFSPADVPTIGASGAIFGILTAFGMLFPERVVTLLVFFILPVSMKAKHLVMIFIGIELALVFSSIPGDPIAHFAHLGGALFGFLYVKNVGGIRTWEGPRLFRAPRLRVINGGAGEEEARDLRERIDVILDKISRHGVSHLTEEEKELLRRARDEL